MRDLNSKKYLHAFLRQIEENEGAVPKTAFDKRCSVSEKGGRPYSYSPIEIEEAMWRYFHQCVDMNAPFSITGWCIAVGISRAGLYGLEKASKGEFAYIIKKGRGIVEFYWEYMGQTMPNPSFAIFVLKNMGWK